MCIFEQILGATKTSIWAIVVMLAIVMLGIMGCYLLGCQRATVTEEYRSLAPTATTTGEILPQEKVVARTTAHTRVMTWTGPAPGETISHIQPLEVTDTGAKFSGMKPFDLARVCPTILLWTGIGIAVIGVGIAVILPAARSIGLYAAGGGSVLGVAGIAFEAYPWLALVLVIAVAAGGVLWFIFGTAAGAKIKESFRAVVAGVEATKKTDPAAAEKVTANIYAAAAGTGKATTVKAAVNAAKPKA